jgi:hypothetical protein
MTHGQAGTLAVALFLALLVSVWGWWRMEAPGWVYPASKILLISLILALAYWGVTGCAKPRDVAGETQKWLDSTAQACREHGGQIFRDAEGRRRWCEFR